MARLRCDRVLLPASDETGCECRDILGQAGFQGIVEDKKLAGRRPALYSGAHNCSSLVGAAAIPEPTKQVSHASYFCLSRIAVSLTRLSAVRL